jgi:hypothetical protein
MHETEAREFAPRPDDQATEHDEHEWRVSLDDPGRRVRRTPDMDWSTAIWLAYSDPPHDPAVYPYQQPVSGDCCSVDLSPGDPAGSEGTSDHLCPHPDPNTRAAAPHADPDQGVVVPGRPVRLTYGDGLPGSIATAIPDPDADLPGLHHPRATRGDVSGAVWQGGSAHAHAAADHPDASDAATGSTLGGYG